MKVVIQNLQKKKGLATRLIEEVDPDVFLAQEIHLSSEAVLANPRFASAHTTSRRGFGTAIIAKEPLSDVQGVISPHAESGGFIVKKTTLARAGGVLFVSFHGYNGTPFRRVDKLCDHVAAVLERVPEDGPAVFGGDWNSWTPAHLDAISLLLESRGFTLAYSWPYPGREVPLDHVFLRGLTLVSASHFRSGADHLGALLSVELAQ
jgi:endonuclease/exonuclease/phosphatase (EEP) superfamily protein YafD